MTKEAKAKIKDAAYAEYRAEAVTHLKAMGVPNVEDSWEGMMKAIDYMKAHANREGEFSGVVMAAAKWMHGFLEQDTACRMKKAEELFAAEAKAAPASVAKV